MKTIYWATIHELNETIESPGDGWMFLHSHAIQAPARIVVVWMNTVVA